jgi:predicted O-methyltransferase YrrM
MLEQNPEEFEWLLSFAEGASSILEVGSRKGTSTKGFAQVAKPGARICAIDIGVAPNGDAPGWNTGSDLQDAIDELQKLGFDAQVMIRNSHDPKAIAWAKERAPFDLVFIDANHAYEDVKQDWENYGPLGCTVAFSNIYFVATEHGVHKLWADLKKTGWEQSWPMQEKVVAGHGIGIIRMPQAQARAA